jgi:SAM-dependent methyltransferase
MYVFFAGLNFISPLTRDCLQAYFAPNDDTENDRLDMHHHLAALILGGKLTTAPIGTNPQRILDVGCGTGIWSIEAGTIIPFKMSREESAPLTFLPGDEFPSAQVLGVDLSPIQPSM